METLPLGDELTGLFNSRCLWTRMNEQWAKGIGEKSANSLVLFGLDFYKKINDRYGHPVLLPRPFIHVLIRYSTLLKIRKGIEYLAVIYPTDVL
ncbi:MAG TPA: diguanylate cyclase [Desulfobulbaceae bacterium]|nr:diguanylate cyclase [Desulfobulbaceae bacterium]